MPAALIHHGAAAIAERLSMTPRQVYRLHETGQAPFVVKLGNRLCAREDAIEAWFAEMESRAAAPLDAN